MDKKANNQSSIFCFRKITALFISAIILITALSACTQNGGNSVAKISEEEAKKIALEDCGLQESEILNKKTELDAEDGVLVYEFEFYSSTHQYEYDIDANTGKIISKSKEVYDNSPAKTTAETVITDNTDAAPPTSTYESASETITGGPAQVPQAITLEQAKIIALNDAGVSENSVSFTKEKQDIENGIIVYEFDFYTNAKEYEYEVDLQGNIVKKEIKPYSVSAPAPAQYITADEAFEKALADAGFTRSQVTNIKSEFDREDSKYEIEFYKDYIEYEYEIDAVSGRVLKRETDNHGSVASPQIITAEEAVLKALADAGFTRLQVTGIKAEFDRDDRKYEIEFYKGYTEYEYEIDAANGNILKREIDTYDGGHHHSHHNCCGRYNSNTCPYMP